MAKKNEQQFKKFSVDIISGFFEADGSFQVKVHWGTLGNVTFHVNIEFTQKTENKEILTKIVTFVEKRIPEVLQRKRKVGITNRDITNTSGTLSSGSSFVLSFSSEEGKYLLDMWEKNPPNAPTKLLNFRIACLLYEAGTVNALTVVNQNLSNNLDYCDDLLTAQLSLLWLRHQMYASETDVARRETLEKGYEKAGATEEQIKKSTQIGEKLLVNIKQEQQQIESDPNLLVPRISDERLAGTHIGDGCFTVQTTFGKGTYPSFKMTFKWYLVDCAANLPFLLAIQKKLEKRGVRTSLTSYEGWSRLSINNLEGCKILTDCWKDVDFPPNRQKQYDCFCKMLDMYKAGKHREELAHAQELIRLKWQLNPGSTKKGGSLEEDLEKVEHWFYNRRGAS